MKLKKIYWLFLGIIVVFAACGSDDSAKDRALTYRESVLDSVKVFVGSSVVSEGGKRDATIEITSDQALKYFSRAFETYTKATVSIDNNQLTITQGGLPEVNACRIENDILFVSNGSELSYFGYMNQGKLIIVQDYVYSKQANGTITLRQVSPSNGLNGEKVAKSSPYGSLLNMTSQQDTMMWCTRRSTFQ